ncbi:MAG: hypothetical protein GY938_07400, partial [Ketobacter sp.]|nr:hypothetical protein [Ketobacter sp.]
MTSSGDVTNSLGAFTIATSAVTSTKVLDETLTASDLNATLTFSDADFVDLAAIVHDDTALQGLRLPQIGASPASPVSGEG